MRFTLILACLLVTTLTYAQDNIMLRSGEEIPAKVLEVNQSELKYRKTANPDGPIYTAPLRDVFLIKYANGTKDVFGNPPATRPADATAPEAGLDKLRYNSRWFNRHFEDGLGRRLSMRDAEEAFQRQPDALTAFDRGRSLRTWSAITGGTGVALIGVGAGLALSDRHGPIGRDHTVFNPGRDNNGRRNTHIGAAVAGSGVLLGVASLWLSHRASVQFRRAADRYSIRPVSTLRIAPASKEPGLGLLLTLN
ncbi:hypothetical protein FAES_5396 [Fibrella aestuarina BUZ 2]|uniref:Uncharacterized protein n=1 Tax=Fibrella aestuarina BUZ 2 TaxID=1166018 RepID=I0KGZ2_9BACT|nr:hypothetical protein [Fibrella aestuarina]CCH03395.1 hypothetical protein FAES_5396 [Fibrella aestuarina BUZ 2]